MVGHCRDPLPDPPVFTIPPSYPQEWNKPQWFDRCLRGLMNLSYDHGEGRKPRTPGISLAQTDLSPATSCLLPSIGLPLRERDRRGKWIWLVVCSDSQYVRDRKGGKECSPRRAGGPPGPVYGSDSSQSSAELGRITNV